VCGLSTRLGAHGCRCPADRPSSGAGRLETLLPLHLHAAPRRGTIPADWLRQLRAKLAPEIKVLAGARDVRMPAQLRAACACQRFANASRACPAQSSAPQQSIPAVSAEELTRRARMIADAVASRTPASQGAFAACFKREAMRPWPRAKNASLAAWC
jgi:hypothetical protein